MLRTPLVFVLGSPRSGTSALTRVLSLCGCRLPSSVFAADNCNVTGYWEPSDATTVNARFLSRHHSTLEDPSLRLLESPIDNEERVTYVQEIRRILSAFPPGPPVVFKELRVTLVFDYWLEAAAESGFDAKAVIVIRHPAEVVASMQEGMRTARKEYATLSEAQIPAVEFATASWLKLNILAERQTRGIPRVFVNYANLLRDWNREVDRIKGLLEISLSPAAERIATFLTTSLQHQRAGGSVPETFAYSWVSRVYASLLSASEDFSIDVACLNEIYDAYRINERAFRIAWDAYCNWFRVLDRSQMSTLAALPVWKHGSEY